MPYKISQKGKTFFVEKESGRVIGTHPTKSKAMAQMKALYANASPEEKTMDKEHQLKKGYSRQDDGTKRRI